MRWTGDDWKESLLALAKVAHLASHWPGEPGSQEQTRNYSVALMEELEISGRRGRGSEEPAPDISELRWLHLSDLHFGSRIPYEWPTYDLVVLTGDILADEYPGARAETTRPRADNEVVALRGKIAALEEEQGRLRERLQRLEHKLDDILSMPGEMETVPVDPHTRWIQENLETLRNHPDEWIALHPVRGILFHTADGDEFAGMLDGLSADERDEVLAFHSSMYI